MDVLSMNLDDYCALNRPRFRVDPRDDAHWFFGNREVEASLLARIQTDIDVRGVPKCGVIGRFGFGKTHTLHHIRWLAEQEKRFPFRAFLMDVVWDENNKELNSWKNIHARMLDALGEDFIREVVRGFEKQTKDQKTELADAMFGAFRFGDTNLRRSLATILAEYFKREVKSTVPAWQWLKADSAAKPEVLQVPMLLKDSTDMVYAILNIGALHRVVDGQGLVFLMDEAQNFGDVRKADSEVHRAFLKLAEQDNDDVGFILTTYGGGQDQIPKVVTTPADVLARLGVTTANINEAFILLRDVIQTEKHVREFMVEVLENIVQPGPAQKIIDSFGLTGVSANHLPFTELALDRIAKALANREENRNPRQIILAMASACSRAYHAGKDSGRYVLVTPEVAEPVIVNM